FLFTGFGVLIFLPFSSKSDWSFSRSSPSSARDHSLASDGRLLSHGADQSLAAFSVQCVLTMGPGCVPRTDCDSIRRVCAPLQSRREKTPRRVGRGLCVSSLEL